MDKFWKKFTGTYDELFSHIYGPLRSVVEQAGEKFLRCGILDYGFARIKCPDCHEEYLLAFSCKCKGLCPSCARKRQLIFADFLLDEVFEPVMHRHIVISIPKRLRIYFRNNRKLLPQLSRLAYKSVLQVLQKNLDDKSANCAAIIATQTFGSLLDFTPHVHGIFAWGLFSSDGLFTGARFIPDSVFEEVFRHNLFKYLLKQDLITEDIIENMLSWRNSGFSVYIGPLINVFEKKRLEHLAGYIARGPVALKRFDYMEDSNLNLDKEIILAQNLSFSESSGKVIYKADRVNPKYQSDIRTWDPLTFLADLTQHIPEKFQKNMNYYGWYSNRARGERKAKSGKSTGGIRIQEINNDRDDSSRNKSYWAKYIKKIYEVDPLTCPKCQGKMYFVSFIEDSSVIYKILKHLDLLGKDPENTKSRDPPEIQQTSLV